MYDCVREEEVVILGTVMLTVQSVLRAAWGGVNCTVCAEGSLGWCELSVDCTVCMESSLGNVYF